jgi:hypothetical protein
LPLTRARHCGSRKYKANVILDGSPIGTDRLPYAAK